MASKIAIAPEWVAPTRTALCIIDVQIDFASPDGLLGMYGIDMLVVQPAIDKICQLRSAAEKAGVPVIFIGLATSPDNDSPVWKQWMTRQGRDAETESAICRQGSVGAEFYGCKPRDKDYICWKSRYSAFWQTSLDDYLRQQNIDTLIMSGITTECCVESTVRDAFHHDYHIIVADDCCAAYEDDIHIASLKTMALNFALIAPSEEIKKAWIK